MAISFVADGFAAATTITIPVGHQPGDLILIVAYNSAAATAPSAGSGFTTPGTATGRLSPMSGTATSSGFRLGYKIATSSSETSGTWTNATNLIVVVYRGAATAKLPPFGFGVFSVTEASTSITYKVNNTATGSTGTFDISGNSWIVVFGIASAATNTGTLVPTSLALRDSSSGSAIFDSNGGITVFAGNGGAKTLNVSGKNMSCGVELVVDDNSLVNYQNVKVGNGMGTTERIK